MAKRKKQPQAIEVIDGPTQSQLTNGHYDRHRMPDPEGGNRVAQVHVNRGGEINGRLFKSMHFDRMEKAGQFSRDQYEAGVWYRYQYEMGRFDNPQMSNLFKIGGSVVSIMGPSERSQVARDRWRAARMALPADMIGFVDALLLRNSWPKMHHRVRFKTLDKLRDALDRLASFIRADRA